MRTNTTNTQLRRIMKLHSNGLNANEISETMFIDPDVVQKVIDVRTAPPKKTRKKKASTEA